MKYIIYRQTHIAKQTRVSQCLNGKWENGKLNKWEIGIDDIVRKVSLKKGGKLRKGEIWNWEKGKLDKTSWG